MTIEIAVLISVIGVFISIYNFINNGKKEAKSDQAQMTSVLIKLESIQDDTKEIKSDLKDVKADIKNHETRIVILEQEFKDLKGAGN